MNKLKYLAARIRGMDFNNMMRQARVVRKRTGRPCFITLVDMIYCGFRYMAGYMDYVVFEFYRLNRAQRKTQITRCMNNALVRRFNAPDSFHKFDRKNEFNEIFADCLHRDWLDLSSADEAALQAFCGRHAEIIVKPCDGACGKGIEKLKISDFSDPESLRQHCLQTGQTVAEQIIVQHSKLNELFAGCVNTVRMVTITHNGKVHVVFCAIRIGAGNTLVDNLNSGGMAALVDADTGCIKTDAADKNGVVYQKHPDTGTVIQGFEIPFFREGRAMVEQAALRVPEIAYVGWDIAFQQDGPLLIEGNHFPGHDIYGMPALTPDGYGFWPQFQAAIAED